MEKIERVLRRFSKEVLNPSSCEVVKKRLLLTISGHEEMKNRVHSVSDSVRLPMLIKAGIKERLMVFVSRYSRFRFFFSGFFVVHKKAWAFGVLFVFVLNLFAFVDAGVPVAEAKNTVLEGVSGEVAIERDGLTFTGEEDFVLEEGDTVMTKSDGRAVIRFFDHSVSRLKENTEVVLSKLVNHDLELGLKGGAIWSFVGESDLGSSEFVVRSSEVLAEAMSNAAFNVSADHGEFKVEVFEEEVNIKIIKNDKPVQESVKKGSLAKVVTEEAEIAVEEIYEEDTWIVENLNKDSEYLGETIKEEAGTLPESVLHPIKLIKEDTKLLLTFDDAQREKVKLEIVEKRLLEAEAMGVGADLGALQTLMDEFQFAADEFMKNIASMQETDPVQYVDLTVYLKKKLGKHKRNLAFIKPEFEEEVIEKILEVEKSVKPLEDIEVLEEEAEVSESLRQASPILILDIEETQDEPECADECADDPESHDNL